jgi:nitroreductase
MTEIEDAAPTSTSLAVGEDAPIFELLRTTRAIRRLEPRPVPRDVLLRLVEAATWAPSGGNAQDISFTIVDDPAVVARIAPLWRRAVDFYTGMKGPPAHDKPGGWDRIVAAIRYQADHFEEIPALIVVGFTTRPTQARMDKRAMLEGARALGPRVGLQLLRNMPKFLARGEAACVYPAVQNLLLAARAHGLGAVMSTWHLWFEQELKDILAMPRDVHTFALVPVGYPKGKLGPVTRKPVDEFVHWNSW